MQLNAGLVWLCVILVWLCVGLVWLCVSTTWLCFVWVWLSPATVQLRAAGEVSAPCEPQTTPYNRAIAEGILSTKVWIFRPGTFTYFQDSAFTAQTPAKGMNLAEILRGTTRSGSGGTGHSFRHQSIQNKPG